MLSVPLANVREKSVKLGRLFRRLVDLECFEWGFQLASPYDEAERGSQICFTHPEGYSIMQVGLVHTHSCIGASLSHSWWNHPHTLQNRPCLLQWIEHITVLCDMLNKKCPCSTSWNQSHVHHSSALLSW